MIGSNFFSSISTNFDSPKWINSKETINPEYDDDNCSQYDNRCTKLYANQERSTKSSNCSSLHK